MKELSYNEPKNTLYIQTHGYNLQVFRVGDSPKINASENKESSSKQFKSIHTHFTYEIFFVVSGKLKIVTETYSKCYQKSILIIPPKMKHVTFSIEGESYCLLFSFNIKTAPHFAELFKKCHIRTWVLLCSVCARVRVTCGYPVFQGILSREA